MSMIIYEYVFKKRKEKTNFKGDTSFPVCRVWKAPWESNGLIEKPKEQMIWDIMLCPGVERALLRLHKKCVAEWKTGSGKKINIIKHIP